MYIRNAGDKVAEKEGGLVHMILAGGENLIDFIQERGDGGHPIYRAIPGGAPYNCTRAMARQGCDVGYLTPFSNDTLGTLLADDLARDGVTYLAPRSDCPTSLAVVSLSDGQASYQFYREETAERDVTYDTLLASVPEQAKALYVGSLAITAGRDAEAWTELFLTLSGRGLFTAIDPYIRAPFIKDRDVFLNRLDRLMKSADLVKLSDEDIGWIHPDLGMRAAAQAIFDQSAAALVVLTMGSEGAIGITQGGEIEIPPVRVPDLKDTVGAGDTFMGTLIAQTDRHGLLRKHGLNDASPDVVTDILKTAAQAAAINCGRVGCNPPTLADLGLT